MAKSKRINEEARQDVCNYLSHLISLQDGDLLRKHQCVSVEAIISVRLNVLKIALVVGLRRLRI